MVHKEEDIYAFTMSGPTEAYPWNIQNGHYKLGTKMIICYKKTSFSDKDWLKHVEK